MTIKTALPHGEFFWVLPEAKCLPFEGFLVEEVLRQYPHTPRSDGGGVEPLVHDFNGQRVNYLYCLNRFIVCDPWREILWIHDGFIGELDIIGIKDMTIMKEYVGSQVKDQDGIVFGSRKEFSGIRS